MIYSEIPNRMRDDDVRELQSRVGALLSEIDLGGIAAPEALTALDRLREHHQTLCVYCGGPLGGPEDHARECHLCLDRARAEYEAGPPG